MLATPTIAAPFRRLATAFAALLAGSVVSAAGQEEPLQAAFAEVRLAEGVHLFRPQGPGPARSNSVVVERADGVLVLDAQPEPEAARLLLEQIRRRTPAPVRYLVLSHPHAESAGGASAFPDETLVIATLDFRDALTEDGFDFGAEVRALQGDAWVEPPLPRPTALLTGPMTLDDPHQPVELMPLAGVHCAGDLLIELPAADLLYAGGVVFPDGNPYAAGARVGAWIAVLTRLLEMAPSRIVGVRGPVLRADDLRRERDALAWIRGHVEQGFVDQLPLETIERRVLTTPGIEQRFDTQASPSFLPLLVRKVVEESADHRRKRGRPIPGETGSASARQDP